jgi:hypothetical protein
MNMQSGMGFFVGQKVISQFYGVGEVVALRVADGDDYENKYPVIVKFNDDENSLIMFTASGRYLHNMDDTKMDIFPAMRNDDHSTLPIEWPGPISRLLFSDDLETVRVKLLIGGGGYALGIITAAVVMGL